MRGANFTLGVDGAGSETGGAVSVKVVAADGPFEITAGGDTTPAVLGETVVFDEPVGSSGFRVKNLHDSDNEIELMIFETSKGGIKSPSSSVAINNEPMVEIKPGSSLVGLPLITLAGDTKIVAASPGRKRVTLVTDSGNTGLIWVGSTAANVGLPLPKDATHDLDIDGEISLFGTGTVYVLEVY